MYDTIYYLLPVSFIADRIRLRTGDAGARERLYRCLAAAVQLGNAACIIEAHSQNASSADARGGAYTAPRHCGAIVLSLTKRAARTGVPIPR